MFEGKSCNDVILHLKNRFKIIAPDEDSIVVARNLWQDWKKSGVVPPDIDGIANEYHLHENGFFYEIVSLAEKQAGNKFSIHLCQFTLDRYNAYAFTAKDGYIVLVDDVFFQILFFICNFLVFDAMDALDDDSERKPLQEFIHRVIQTNYLNRKRIDFSGEPQVVAVFKKDYELAEFANYLFHAFKAFIISHEIGHHVLGHTTGIEKRTFKARGEAIEVEVDSRLLQMEYEADDYGYKLFDTLSQTVDDSVYYAFCQYKFPFAPILLFNLFEKLDIIYGKHENVTLPYNEHPHPNDRSIALQAKYNIDVSDPLYLDLKKSLDYFLDI